MKKKIIIALIVVCTAGIAANPILIEGFFSISQGYLLGVSSKGSNQEIKSTDIEIRELQTMMSDYKQATRNDKLERQLSEQRELLRKQSEQIREQERQLTDLTRKLDELSRKVK